MRHGGRTVCGLLAASLLLLAGCATSSKTVVVPTGEAGRSQVIAKYLSGRTLDPVEGIWRMQDISYELAIVRNRFGIKQQYQYLAFVVGTRHRNWHNGELKMMLQSTSDPAVFSGVYLMNDASPVGTTFELQTPNRMGIVTPSGPNGSRTTTTYLKMYPLRDRGTGTRATVLAGDASAGGDPEIVSYAFDAATGKGTIAIDITKYGIGARDWLIENIGKICSSKNIALESGRPIPEGARFGILDEKVAGGVLSMDFEVYY